MKVRPPVPTIPLNPHRAIAGIYYGFPICCVRQLANNIFTQYLPEWEGKSLTLNGTGFIPCVKCANEKTEAQLLLEINNNRICPLPFPDGDVTLKDDIDPNAVLRSLIARNTEDSLALYKEIISAVKAEYSIRKET